MLLLATTSIHGYQQLIHHTREAIRDNELYYTRYFNLYVDNYESQCLVFKIGGITVVKLTTFRDTFSRVYVTMSAV